MSGSSPLLQAARLRKRPAPRGTRYMQGPLGGVKVVILPNRDYVEGDLVNGHTQNLFFQDGSSVQPKPAAVPAEQRKQGGSPNNNQQMEDDPLPFRQIHAWAT